MTVTGGPGTDVMRDTASQGTDIITIAADRVTTSAQGGPPVVHPFSGIETMTVGGFTLGDTFNVIPLPATVPLRSTAGRILHSVDTLNFDAQGKVVTGGTGTLSVTGAQPVTYSEFEVVNVLNEGTQTPTPTPTPTPAPTPRRRPSTAALRRRAAPVDRPSRGLRPRRPRRRIQRHDADQQHRRAVPAHRGRGHQADRHVDEPVPHQRRDPGRVAGVHARRAAAGQYLVEFRVGNRDAGSTFSAEFGAANGTGPLAVPDTDSFDAFTTVSRTMNLAAGVQVLRFTFQSPGTGGYGAALDWIRISRTQTPTPTPTDPPDTDANAHANSHADVRPAVADTYVTTARTPGRTSALPPNWS